MLVLVLDPLQVCKLWQMSQVKGTSIMLALEEITAMRAHLQDNNRLTSEEEEVEEEQTRMKTSFGTSNQMDQDQLEEIKV